MAYRYSFGEILNNAVDSFNAKKQQEYNDQVNQWKLQEDVRRDNRDANLRERQFGLQQRQQAYTEAEGTISPEILQAERNFYLGGTLPGALPDATRVSQGSPQGMSGGTMSIPSSPGQAFLDKYPQVTEMAKRIGANPSDVVSVMGFETGNTFDPSIRNKAGSGATGLLQFMPSTARGMGTTTDELAKMTVEQQLPYAEKYWTSNPTFRGKLGSLENLAASVFYPPWINDPTQPLPESMRPMNPGITSLNDYVARVRKNMAGVSKLGTPVPQEATAPQANGLLAGSWNGRYTKAEAQLLSNMTHDAVPYNMVPEKWRKELGLKPGSFVPNSVMTQLENRDNLIETFTKRDIEARARNIDSESMRMASQFATNGRVDVHALFDWLATKNDGLTRERLSAPGMQAIANSVSNELADIRQRYPTSSWDLVDRQAGKLIDQPSLWQSIVNSFTGSQTIPQNILKRYRDLRVAKDMFESAGRESGGREIDRGLLELRQYRQSSTQGAQ